jgi:DNA polymerase
MGSVGELITKILLAIGLKRENCYLTNVVKYISRGEDLTPDILKFFTPFLPREIMAIRPKVIISLGNTPIKALLETKKPISKIRGEFHNFSGIQLMPTFNPAYLLRDPTKKREVWEDMKMVRGLLIK